jgi:hypothetical protein
VVTTTAPLVLATVILQSAGLAPAMRIAGSRAAPGGLV